jgi:hypothetical protein
MKRVREDKYTWCTLYTCMKIEYKLLEIFLGRLAGKEVE